MTQTGGTTTRRPDATCDVAIVGAGPAGISTAIHLHWAGRSVQVFDKARFPRDKCCGDGLTTLALRELESLQFHPRNATTWRRVDAATMVTPAGHHIEVPLSTDSMFAATAERRDLDNALVEHARRLGIAVHDGWAFTSMSQRGASVEITVAGPDDSSMTVASHYLVGADGAWSKVRSAIGATPADYRGEAHAFRQYLSGVTGPAAEELFVWFEPDLLPGYAWSFPLGDGRVNFGFGTPRDERPTGWMRAAWGDLLDRPHIRAALGEGATGTGRVLAWPIPARIDQAIVGDGRTLLVGDAATATDLLTGEGIGQALETGRLAAHSIASAGSDRPEVAVDEYRRAVRQHLVADHRMSRLLSRFFSTERGAEVALGIVRHAGAWGRRSFARWMFEDEPRAILLTPRRWHRALLRRPGAYARIRIDDRSGSSVRHDPGPNGSTAR